MRFATVMLGVFGLIVLLTSPVSAQYYARGGHYGDGWPADAGNQLNDDGLNGDAMAGDGIHSGYVTSDKVAGDYEFKIAVEDWSENYPASNVPIRLTSDNQVIFFSLNTNLIEDGCVPTQYIVWSDAIRVGTTWSVVGSAAELGGWDLPSAPQASEDGGLWTLSVDFAAGGDYEYKWVADLDWGFQQVGSDGFGNNTWGIQLHLDDAATVVFTLDLSVPRACHEALVPTEMSLCEATLLDGDYFPVHYDEWVHITSPLLILNDDGTFSSGNVDAGATDGECCVCLFDFNVTDVLMAGDLVDVIGTV
ncbi:MAG: hypothetical protein KAY32_16220, partial [Candidatus Eisenbacteria sp.]|nr:hypothetical protein [Candidatus Eisenbacteria bacterium]